MAKLRQFEKVSTDDPNLNRVQQGMEEALRPVFSSEILGGKLVIHEFLTSSPELVFHGLGREIKGWIRVRALESLSGDPLFPLDLEVIEGPHWTGTEGNPDPNKFVVLKSNLSDIKVSFWIF